MTSSTSVLPSTAVRPAALLGVLLTGQAMASMDTSIAAVAAPAIRADLAADGAAQQLVLAGYTLAFAVLVVTGARLGGRHGHARMFRLGLAGFTVTSLLCGLAPGPAPLILARIAQGATAALMVPQVLALIQRNFTGSARGRAIASYSAVLALGVAGGQIAGGLLVTADLAGLAWRTAFLVNVPVGLALLVVAGRILPAEEPAAEPLTGDRRETGALGERQVSAGPAGERRAPAGPAGERQVPAGQRRQPLDLAGVFLLAASLLALVLPLVLGREAGWPAWAWATGLSSGAAGIALFHRQQRRLAQHGGEPVLDLTVLALPGVRSGLVAACLVMLCYAGCLFALTLRLQDGLGFTALAAGLAFLPYPVGFAGCGLLAARLPEPVRNRLPVLGPLVMGGALVLVAGSAWTNWPALPASGALLLAGAGHAAGFSPLAARIAAAVPTAAASALSALVSTGTLLAAVLGVTVLGGIQLAVTERVISGTAAGLGAVTVASAVLLAGGARLAARAGRRLTGFGQRPTRPADKSDG